MRFPGCKLEKPATPYIQCSYEVATDILFVHSVLQPPGTCTPSVSPAARMPSGPTLQHPWLNSSCLLFGSYTSSTAARLMPPTWSSCAPSCRYQHTACWRGAQLIVSFICMGIVDICMGIVDMVCEYATTECVCYLSAACF